ncbi:molybdopterin-dependent oxidoreductase [soil metagenome]
MNQRTNQRMNPNMNPLKAPAADGLVTVSGTVALVEATQPVPAWQPIHLHINGQAHELASHPAARLSDVLRDDLRLTGTKIGCHAGDCGACTVLLDGEQVCACIVALGQCAGRAVTTVEGLAGAGGELSPLQQAFVAHGAAQCGICTPGMLMSAESLLRTTPLTSEPEVLDAIGGVLCRCTGYRKIVEAVLSVASGDASMGVSLADIAPAAGQAVGARLARLDAPAKVRGEERFGADEWPGDAPAGTLTLRVIRSPHAHARFTLGDMAAFIASRPGIVEVITAADVPHNAFAIFAELRDQPVLADGLVRFAGEAVVALVGEADAVFAVPEGEVPIAYEVLPAFGDMPGALQAAAQGVLLQAAFPDNVLCRGRVVRGDVDAAFGAAAGETSAPTEPAHIAECRVETAYVEHAYIEPEAGYAQWLEAEGAVPRIRIYASTQTPYMDRDEIAHVMGLAPAQVHIVPSAIGGGFGGKLDLSVQPLLAVAARKTRRAVRLVYERPESMQSSTKRHPSDMHARAACDAAGRLSAYDFEGDFNTGAYSSWGPTVANRVPIHASGPYRIPNVRATTRAVLTHNSVAGAFRGFGVPQSTLLNERLLDELAAHCGMDQLEFRHLNALRAGDTTPTGQVLAASVGLQECLDALRPAWRRAKAEAAAFNASAVANAGASHLRRGAGIACMWYGIGNTVIANPSTMRGSLRLSAGRGAHLFLYNGAQEIGQGTATVMPQMFADAVGLPVGCVEQVMGDTDLTLDAGKSSASRQTFVSGNAARFAGQDLRRQLLAALGFDQEAAQADASAAASTAASATSAGGGAARIDLRLDGRYLIAGDRRIDLRDLPRDVNGDVFTGLGHFNPPTVPLDADGQGVPYATFGFAAQIAELEVDTELGTVRLLHIHAAHDVGHAINPTQVEGQVHGGIAQGIGLALMEEYVNGRTDNLHDYLIPTAGDVPPITVHRIEDPEPLGPWGAKGVGEPALVATAPAILNAIFDAVGVRMGSVPVTPSRLRAAMPKRGAR